MSGQWSHKNRLTHFFESLLSNVVKWLMIGIETAPYHLKPLNLVGFVWESRGEGFEEKVRGKGMEKGG